MCRRSPLFARTPLAAQGAQKQARDVILVTPGFADDATAKEDIAADEASDAQ